MSTRLYVGNLPWAYTATDLQTLFGPFGSVVSAEIVSDRMTGRSRGFGFVEMESDATASAAITALNGSNVAGRPITVNEARERMPRNGPRDG